uniref:Rieske domain-containing protein n=1 Tax=Ditylenchus dipsaci TaxID=166011 RepID=A0A915E979_9BILA
MSTLLRTNSSASRLVAGCFPVSSAPSYPVKGVVKKAVAIKDPAAKVLTGQTLQTVVSQQANAIAPLLRSVRNVTLVSCRHSSTDVTFPNFDAYRHDSTKDPTKPASESEDERRVIPNGIVYGVGGMMAIYFGSNVLNTVAVYKSMAADQKALANIEIDLSEIPEGKSKTFEWRGKPIFVSHRTQKQIEEVRAVNVSELRHPETDESRTKKPEWMISVGICTHLGCVPFANMGEFDGYLCPCHGSHYDASVEFARDLLRSIFIFPNTTSQESVGKLLEAGNFCNGANTAGVTIYYAVYAPLTVSTIAGVSCTILYLANIWFCYKETASFRTRNSRTIQMDQDPYTLE